MFKNILLKTLSFALLTTTFAAPKQNVLFIAVDDLKPTLEPYGSTVPTPAIKRLAARGTTFLNAHCQQAVCAPSRASIMTGKYPDFTKVWDLKTKMRDINPEILTLGQHFKANGYSVIGMGKIFDSRSVDSGGDRLSWSEPHVRSWQAPHNRVVGPQNGHYLGADIKALTAQANAEAGKELAWGPLNQWLFKNGGWPAVESADVPDDAYHDGAVAKLASQTIARLAKKEEPFFLAVGFKRPHLPFTAPKKYWDRFDRDAIELAPYQQPAEGAPKYALHRSEELRTYNGVPQSGPLDPDTQRKLIHGYYACVSYIDALVGQLLDQLEAQGLTENTTVVLWGDHGWHLGDHGIWCKHTNYEQATRVPLIIAAPGGFEIKTNMPAELTDVFPTLCGLSGIPIPGHLDGINLAPNIRGAKSRPRAVAMSQYPRGPLMGYALRDERYRYVVWFKTGGKGAQIGDPIDSVELYDYDKDPLETRNLAKDPAYRETTDALSKQLLQFIERMNGNA
jgi:arylsulfatase A-like enzyme